VFGRSQKFSDRCGFALLLALLRVVWTVKTAKRRPISGIAAKLGHFALNLLMIIVPVSGIALKGEMPHGVLAMLFLLLDECRLKNKFPTALFYMQAA